MVLTAEASGIALATAVATYFHKPMIFAKKAKSDNIEGGLYQSDILDVYKRQDLEIVIVTHHLSRCCSTIKICLLSVLFSTETSLLPYFTCNHIVQFSRCRLSSLF